MKKNHIFLVVCWVMFPLEAASMPPLLVLCYQQGTQGVQKKKSFFQKMNPFDEMGEEVTMTLYPPAEFPLAGKVLLITYKNESGDKNNDGAARKLAAMVQSAVQDGLLDVRISMHEEKGRMAALLRGSYDGLHKQMLKIGEFQTAELLLRVKLLESAPYDGGWGSQEIKVRGHRAAAIIELIDLQQGVSLKTKTVTAEEREEGFNADGLAARTHESDR